MNLNRVGRCLLLGALAWMVAALPAVAQGKKDFVMVPRDAPNIAAALTALPGGGTIFVTDKANPDPGFTAMGLKKLTIAVSPNVPITGSAVFTKCTNVFFACNNIDKDLHIDECTDVRVMSATYGYMQTPPLMLEIRQAAYVKNSTDIHLVGLGFKKGAYGIRISGCMDKPAELLDGWRRSKTPGSIVRPTPLGVRVNACTFVDLAPLPGTTTPRGVAGTASCVEALNCKFGPYDGYGFELENGSLGGISQCSFEGLSGDAIFLTDAEGFVQSSTISGVSVGPGAGNGIHAVLLPPAKNGPPRFLYVGNDAAANGVKISKCEGNGVWVEGGTGVIEPQIRECATGITASGGFSGRLFSAIDTCNYGIWAIEGFTGSIDGVVRDAKNVGVIVSGTKGPVTIGQPGAISTGNYNIINSGAHPPRRGRRGNR